MGHTRFTTQGSEKQNYNNHPFYGQADKEFALAHNGVLYNDTVLRKAKSLPDTHIDNDSTSTAGGWRVHPHYDVIYRMFRTTVYEPFEDSFPFETEEVPETAQ